MKLIPTEIHEDGELTKIEYHNEAGEFVIEAVWDPEDEQSAENRVKLREWGTKILKQKGYEVMS